MAEFKISRCLASSPADEQRGPEDMVLEYIRTYQKWARNCEAWAKTHPDQIEKLQRGAARETLDLIQKKYCSAKNRQFQRASTGYFFYGGTFQASPVIESCEERGRLCCVTNCKAAHSPSFRFALNATAKHD
ncbi:MAG: hypothetical protein LBJ15_11290 [Comamonas sp.]|jgi:hypothetical protein|uniref:hypothetical protein n=1 Tax=Comamonas sp. TaxID=34028 RepID=UPI0028254563|nr:hypothetical protein [Comamonas sp.]MDR0214575.1 hypothetical protein [Comamonas sp.]